MASTNKYDRLRVKAKETEEKLDLSQALEENAYNEKRDKKNLKASYDSDLAALTSKLAAERENQSMQKAKAQAEYTAKKRAATLRGILKGLGASSAAEKAENTVTLEMQNNENDINAESIQKQTSIQNQLKEAKDNYISKLSEIENEKKKKDKVAENEYRKALLSFYYKMAAEHARPSKSS